jgi:hypothetical protein
MAVDQLAAFCTLTIFKKCNVALFAFKFGESCILSSGLQMNRKNPQKSTNPWINWSFGHGLVDFCLTDHMLG